MDRLEADRVGRAAVNEAKAMYRRMVQGWCQDYLVFRAGFHWQSAGEPPADALHAAGATEAA